MIIHPGLLAKGLAEKPNPPDSSGKPARYPCSNCMQTYTRASGVKRHHRRTHSADTTATFKCTNCSKRFHQKSNLAIHLRVHTGQKPYACAVCDTRFATKGNLTIHLRVHTGQKPYACAVCDNKRFATKGNLTRHNGSKQHVLKLALLQQSTTASALRTSPRQTCSPDRSLGEARMRESIRLDLIGPARDGVKSLRPKNHGIPEIREFTALFETLGTTGTNVVALYLQAQLHLGDAELIALADTLKLNKHITGVNLGELTSPKQQGWEYFIRAVPEIGLTHCFAHTRGSSISQDSLAALKLAVRKNHSRVDPDQRVRHTFMWRQVDY